MAEHLRLGSTLCPGEDKTSEEKNRLKALTVMKSSNRSFVMQLSVPG